MIKIKTINNEIIIPREIDDKTLKLFKITRNTQETLSILSDSRRKAS